MAPVIRISEGFIQGKAVILLKKILFSGYYGFDNTGDEAILQAVSAYMEVKADMGVLSVSPASTMKKYGIRAFNFIDPFEVLRAVNWCDVLVSGGGSLFQDVTSSLSLYYYLAVIMAAILLRKKVFVYSQGIGPVKRQLNRALSAWVLNRTGGISVRDDMSAGELESMGVCNPAIKVTCDPAFLLEPAGENRGREILKAAGLDCDFHAGRPLIGLAPRKWKERNDPVKDFSGICRKLAAKLDAAIVLFPFHRPRDAEFCLEIAEMAGKRVYVAEGNYMPAEVMSAMGLMDVNIGVRLHALVFSAAMGVPPAGIAYDPKIHGFLSALGMVPVCTYRDISPDIVVEAVEGMLGDREGISRKLREKTLEFKNTARMTLEELLQA